MSGIHRDGLRLQTSTASLKLHRPQHCPQCDISVGAMKLCCWRGCAAPPRLTRCLQPAVPTGARPGPGLCAARCGARAIPRYPDKHQTKEITTWNVRETGREEKSDWHRFTLRQDGKLVTMSKRGGNPPADRDLTPSIEP